MRNMKQKMKKSLYILVSCLLLCTMGCVKNEKCSTHIDVDNDYICDVCQEQIEKTISTDNVPPIFIEAQNSRLPKLTIKLGETIDLYNGILVSDDSLEDVDLVISNFNNINFYNPGIYELEYIATDKSGNSTTVYRELEIQKYKTITIKALVIGSEGVEYIYNSDSALDYTSSGAKFRLSDQIHVMDKSFFVNEYNQNKDLFTKNGKEIFFPYGVMVLCDSDGNFKFLRAASNAIQIDEAGTVYTSTFATSQSDNGQGIFKDVLEIIDNLLPNGGYIIFASNRDENISKTFILRNLVNRDYDGGIVRAGDLNMDISNIKITLNDNYKKEVLDDTNNEIMGQINKTEYIYDGIPFATYNYGDGNAKPLLFLFHGFSGDHKTGVMDKGDELAKKGFFVVAMDAYLHGERAPSWFSQLSHGERQKEIVNIQVQTAKDAVHLYNKYFKNDPRVIEGDVYTLGVSMGAGISFYLATIMDEVVAVASIVGSPSFYAFYQEKQITYGWSKDDYYYANLEHYQSIDPLINFEKLEGVYIYMGNGLKDTTVPKKYAEELTTKLDSNYYIYETYDVAHTSTPQMLENAYNYLVSKIKK